MPSQKLTDKLIQKLVPRTQQFEIFDSVVRGLSIRVSPGNTKAFSLSFRDLKGKSARKRIGRYPNVTLEQARRISRQKLGSLAEGIDPRGGTEAERRFSVQEVASQFIQHHLRKKHRRWVEMERSLHRNFVEPFGKKAMRDLTKFEIQARLRVISDQSGPSAANHAFALMRCFCNWAVNQDFIDDSPMKGVPKPAKDRPRERILLPEEIAAVWNAADKAPYPFGVQVQLLILTAQRRSEVGGMKWQNLDLHRKIWTQFADDNKSGRQHSVPLASITLQILSSLPKLHDEWVFPSRKGNTPASGFSKWKRKLDACSGVSNWTLHDLRRTAATFMGQLDVPPHVIELVLNHQTEQIGSLGRIYNRYKYEEQKREALEKWACFLQTILAKEGPPSCSLPPQECGSGNQTTPSQTNGAVCVTVD